MKGIACASAALVWGASAGETRAEALTAPNGKVILTVTGAIHNTNRAGSAVFDMAMMKALPQHAFSTSTIWTKSKATYQGVLLKDLLAAVGADGSKIVATAINDYQVSLPVADVTEDAPLLAYLSDGAPMSLRDKGPIWVMFPFDENPAFRTEQTYSRAIWQLDRLEIDP